MLKNPYKIESARIINIKKETDEVKIFRLEFLDKKIGRGFNPGQFVELSLPGFGEAPFAPCSDCFENSFFELCVRKAGQLTGRLHELKVGDTVGIRGPFGNGWPVAEAKDVQEINYLFIAGGLGIVPFRSLVLAKEKLLGKNSTVQLFYGAKSPKDFIFQDEYNKWKENIEINLTIDKECAGWDACIGPVTALFAKTKIPDGGIAFLCGPPIMYKFVLEKLKEHNFKDEDIFLSLERRMHCGIGICQHCAVGSDYVCKQGPVFSWQELKNIPGVI